MTADSYLFHLGMPHLFGTVPTWATCSHYILAHFCNIPINIIFESNDFAVCWRCGVRFPAGKELCLTSSTYGLALEPTHLVFNVYRLKRLVRGTMHSHSSSAQVNCEGNCAQFCSCTSCLCVVPYNTGSYIHTDLNMCACCPYDAAV